MFSRCIFIWIFVKECSGLSEHMASRNTTLRVEFISWEWAHLKIPLTLVVFILFLIVARILLQRVPWRICRCVPSSCLLLILGILVGLLFRVKQHSSHDEEVMNLLHMNELTFFHVLLPPIVLEAAYGLHSRVFYLNLGKVICFAVFGTLLSAALITAGLCLTDYLNLLRTTTEVDPVELAYFASFIVAVDPVAVLAIFEQLGVNLPLYFIVFGESLFNDAITVVLYRILRVFVINRRNQNPTEMLEMLRGLVAFVTVTGGGILCGVVSGVMSCLITRALRDVESLEPLVILSTGYFAYVVGDLFGLSGLISLIVCGILHDVYTFHNISSKSVITVKRSVKMLAHISESAIFLLLGMDLFMRRHKWNEYGFIGWSIFWVITSRAISVCILCCILNKMASREGETINWKSQIVIIYGGLRGAVAFALAILNSDQMTEAQTMFISATLVIILFTNLVMGTTIKPLVHLLSVEREEVRPELSIFRKMNTCVLEHLTAGIEEIIGHWGVNSILEYFTNIDNRIFRRILLKEPITHDERIVRIYQKISLALHLATVNPERSQFYLERLYRKQVDFESGFTKVENLLENDESLDSQDPDSTQLEDDIVVVIPASLRRKPPLRDTFSRARNLKALDDLRRTREGDERYTFERALELRRKNVMTTWLEPRTLKIVANRKCSEPSRPAPREWTQRLCSGSFHVPTVHDRLKDSSSAEEEDEEVMAL